MSTELPARVQPAPGASIDNFPWGTAGNVAASLDTIVAAINGHLDLGLPGATGLLADWRGQFREDFDTTLDSLCADAGQLAEDCQTAAGNVVTAAENANENQTDANDAAARREAAEDDQYRPAGTRPI